MVYGKFCAKQLQNQITVSVYCCTDVSALLGVHLQWHFVDQTTRKIRPFLRYVQDGAVRGGCVDKGSSWLDMT